MYKEAKRLLSGEYIQSNEKKHLEQLIRGGIEFRHNEAKFRKEEFLGVYGLDKESIKTLNIKRISKRIVSEYLEDEKLENIVENSYPIYLIERNRKEDRNQLEFIKSVYDRYMSNIIDRTGFSGFTKELRIETKWFYLVYLFWRYPTNNHRFYLNRKKNELTIDKWCYSEFNYTIQEVSVSFMYSMNRRLLAITDTNKNTHFYKISTKTGEIIPMNKYESVCYDLATLYSRLRMYI